MRRVTFVSMLVLFIGRLRKVLVSHPDGSSLQALILRIEPSGYPPKQYRYRKYIEVKLAYTKASLPMLASLYVASKCTEGGCCTMVNPRTIVSSIPLIAMAGSSAMSSCKEKM